MTQTETYRLSDEQKQFWLQHGFLKIPKCFTRQAAQDFSSTVWTRLGASADDKSTWPVERLNMPGHATLPAREFAPKAWAAVCELHGGDEDSIADWCKEWKDGFIVNLGGGSAAHGKDGSNDCANGRHESRVDDFRNLAGWHADGDWFYHFLDSPEQALLIIPLFTDIKPSGGGTIICSDGIRLVAERLVRKMPVSQAHLRPRPLLALRFP